MMVIMAVRVVVMAVTANRDCLQLLIVVRATMSTVAALFPTLNQAVVTVFVRQRSHIVRVVCL